MAKKVTKINAEENEAEIIANFNSRPNRYQKEDTGKDISHVTQAIKWRWAGHVVRLEYNRLTHGSTNRIQGTDQEEQADQQRDCRRTWRKEPEIYGLEQPVNGKTGRNKLVLQVVGQVRGWEVT